MNFSDILTMRHELMLTLLALVVLIIDLNLHNRNKHLIIPVTLVLFFLHTVVGFFPAENSLKVLLDASILQKQESLEVKQF